jgi:acetylornithine deacetylase/succinyl-diaminopimelate desuccinylase-like protein
MRATTKLLRELIALPSVNPAFLPGHDAYTGEKRMADFVAATAAYAGLDVDLQEVYPQRDNVIVRYTPAGTIRRRILLAPHLDTVGGDLIPGELFKPRTRNGRLHGRGACDTKGSVAAMLSALIRLAHSPRRPQQSEIIFAGLVDEEHGQDGSRALVRTRFKADLAIVGEPTRLEVVSAHKGNLWLQLATRGKAAHGARPELGRNAVHAMARIVDLLETEYAVALRRRRHPLLGRPTVSVGAIVGGNQANIVPAYCAIKVDRRTLPGETEASVRAEIERLLAKHALIATMADTKEARCWPMQTDPRLPLVQQFLSTVGRKKTVGVDYFCDASVLSRGGIPSIVFGPGDIAQAHTADEWISLRSLERGTDLLTQFLLSLE